MPSIHADTNGPESYKNHDPALANSTHDAHHDFTRLIEHDNEVTEPALAQAEQKLPG